MHVGDLGGDEEGFFVGVVGFFFKETDLPYSVFSRSCHYQHSYYNMLRLLFFLRAERLVFHFFIIM